MCGEYNNVMLLSTLLNLAELVGMRHSIETEFTRTEAKANREFLFKVIQVVFFVFGN